jgi:hypothetical protein
MDIDSGLLAVIDEYISDAMAATGTRRAPRVTQQHQTAFEPEPEMSDLEPQTEPFGDAYAEYELGGAIIVDEQNADGALLAQVAQQLTQSDSALESLPRARAARGTVELDDEVTAIVARPSSKPL